MFRPRAGGPLSAGFRLSFAAARRPRPAGTRYVIVVFIEAKENRNMNSPRRKPSLFAVLAVSAATALAAAASLERANAAALQDDGGFPMEKLLPEHKLIASWAGTWDVTSKWRMDPAAAWDESKGVETVEIACGGFWAVSKFSGTMMGQPMEGRSQTGYDSHKKKFVGTWIDNFGSYLTTMEGTYDEKTKTLVMLSDMFDPMTGATMKVKLTTQDVSADERVMRMHFPTPDGKEFVGMEMTSKRRK